MNLAGITSFLGLDNKPFLDSAAEAGTAVEKLTQDVVESASTAGDGLQALSERLKESLSVPEGWKNISDADAFAGIKAGIIGADGAFHGYQKDVEGGLDAVGQKAKDTADKAAAEADKINQAWGSNLTKALQLAQGAFATFITSIPIYGVVKESTEAIVGFDAALVGMQAHTLVTADAIQGLGVYASVATENLSQFHELDAIAGLEMLSRAGEGVTVAMKNLPAVLDLAAVAGMNVASAADAIVTTMNQFNMSTTDATRVADVYTKASQMSTASTQELASMMRYMAATMDGAGYSFEDTTAYVTAFINAGMMARQASGALSTAVESLANMNAAGQEVLDRYGVALRDAAGKVRPLIDVVLELKKAGASTTDMLSVFGSSSQKITTVLANLGKEGFGNLVSGLKDSKGAAEAAAGVLQTSLASSLATTHKSLADIWLSLGKDMKPALQWFMATINGLLTLVKKAVQSIEGWSTAQKTLLGTFVGISAVVIPLLLLVKTFKDAIGLLSLAMKGLGIATTAAAGTFAVIAIAVAALTAVVFAGITAWKEYQAVMNPVLNAVPGADNIVKMKNQLAQFDKDTQSQSGVGGTAIDPSTGLRTWSDAELKDRAAQRLVLEKRLSDQVEAVRVKTLESYKAGEKQLYQEQAADAKAAANVKIGIAKELSDAIFAVTSTQYQIDKKLIIEQTAAFVKQGVEGGKSLAQATIDANVYKVKAIAKLDKDTAAASAKLSDAAAKKAQTASDAAVKKAQETNDAIVAARVSAQDALDKIEMNATYYALKQVEVEKAGRIKDGVDSVFAEKLAAHERVVIWDDYHRTVKELAEKAIQDAADAADKVASDLQAHLEDIASQWEAYNGQIQGFADSLAEFLKQKYQEDYREKKDTLDEGLRIAQASYKDEEDAINHWYGVESKTLDDNLHSTQETYKAEEQAANDRYDAEITALDNVEQVAQDTYKAEEDAVNSRYDAEIAAFDALTNAKLAGVDARLDELNANKQAGKDVADQASLEHDLVYATTAQERDAIIVKIADLKKEIEYRTAVNALDVERLSIQDAAKVEAARLRESQRTAILDIQTKSAATLAAYNAETVAMKEVQRVTLLDIQTRSTATLAAYDAESLRLKEVQRIALLDIQVRSAATQTAYDTDTKALEKFYYNKMLQRNLDAEAQLMLEGKTHEQILAMMEAQLADYAANGYAAGDAWWNAYLAAVAGANMLSEMNVPGTTAPMSPTWDQGAGQAGYGNFAGVAGAVASVNKGAVGSGAGTTIPMMTGTEMQAMVKTSTDTLIRGTNAKLDGVITAVQGIARGVGSVINGMAQRV